MPFRRALVLAGGGAKGAYAFGVLRAFRKADIHFDAVAGTSVGALNAVLWATDSLDQNERLWTELSFENTYPPSILRWVPRRLRVIIGFCYCFAAAVCSSARQIPTLEYKSFDLTIDLLISVFLTAPATVGGLFWMLNGFSHEGKWPMVVVGLILVWIGCRGITSYCSRRVEGSWYVFLGGGFAWFTTLAILCIGCLNSLGSRRHVVLAYFCSAIITLLLFLLSMRLRRWLKMNTCLRQEPLRQTLTKILSSAKLAIPTFVTCGYRQTVFDPADGSYCYATRPAELIAAELEPNTHQIWAAQYVRINEFLPDDAATLCLASAALPFGVVPPISVSERVKKLLRLPDQVSEFVDGGVADNVPYMPFIEDFPADELFVVLLEPCAPSVCAHAARLTQEIWSARQHKREIAALGVPQSRRLNQSPIHPDPDWPRAVQCRQPRSWPERVEYFCPTSRPSVGDWGLLRGTLNFTGKYAKTLMKMGFEDAKKRLESIRARDVAFAAKSICEIKRP
jgi:predicted acylesterase/phospholipase RssA